MLRNKINQINNFYMTKIEWTFDKNEALLSLIDKFIKHHGITCGEQVMQSDEILLDLPDLMCDIVDILEPERTPDEE